MSKTLSVFSRLICALSLTASVSIFSGCDLQENAAKSAENSKRAADNSTTLTDLNQNAYGDARLGGARERRIDEIAAMIKAETVEAKTIPAAAFFSAMEFQTWKKEDGFREDTAQKREELMADAVTEFLKTAKDFLRSSPDYNRDLNVAVDGNAIALALAMHKTSPRQVEASKRYGFEVKSMMHLLSEALVKQTQINSDPSTAAGLKPYVFEALREYDDVVTFFRLRMNRMTADAAAILQSGFQNNGSGGNIKLQLSPVRLEDARLRLAEAARLRKFFGANSIENKIFGDIYRDIWGNSPGALDSKLTTVLSDMTEYKHLEKSLLEIKGSLEIIRK